MRKNILLLCFWQVFILITVAPSFHVLFLVLFYTPPPTTTYMMIVIYDGLAARFPNLNQYARRY